nr:MAG TPA: hypothetical protein [Caudoviricetes sp.]DAV18380.1 MAG TPA: hypothetical protein [Caudoviricetes sp.]
MVAHSLYCEDEKQTTQSRNGAAVAPSVSGRQPTL